jgi:hypothetical protein
MSSSLPLDLDALPLTLTVKDLRKLLPSIKDLATIRKLAKSIGTRVPGRECGGGWGRIIVPRHRFVAWLNSELVIDAPTRRRTTTTTRKAAP